jgi:hypothetical protein
MGHYASQCLEQKKVKQQQKQFVGSTKASAGVDELASTLEISLSMVSCLSTNTISGVGWYVNNGTPRDMTFNKAFCKLQEQDGMKVEVGNDATYLVTKEGSISFCMPSSDIF